MFALFYRPTVLTDVTSEMKCSTNETFGPLVAVQIVDSEDAAVIAANATEYGLNASVFSRSRARGRAVASRLKAGTVNVNDGYRASFGSVHAPMGGFKKSGMGRRNGTEGLLRYVQSRTIAESTGLLQLPRTGAEWKKLVGPMLLLLRIEKLFRRSTRGDEFLGLGWGGLGHRNQGSAVHLSARHARQLLRGAADRRPI